MRAALRGFALARELGYVWELLQARASTREARGEDLPEARGQMPAFSDLHDIGSPFSDGPEIGEKPGLRCLYIVKAAAGKLERYGGSGHGSTVSSW